MLCGIHSTINDVALIIFRCSCNQKNHHFFNLYAGVHADGNVDADGVAPAVKVLRCSYKRFNETFASIHEKRSHEEEMSMSGRGNFHQRHVV